MELGDARARLLDLVDDGPMDAHARIITGLLGCDAALVTVVGKHEQHFLGRTGLNGALGSRRRTPLSHSLCRVVADQATPLRLERLGTRSEYRDHPARTDLGVEAYLGVPLSAPSGEVVGAVCGLHLTPHTWSDEDVERVAAMRDLVQVELRPLLRSQQDRARTEEVALLLSTLRHELGGELAIVLGGIETAMLPDLDQDLRRRVLHNARRDCRRVISTLDALLRIDARAPAQLRKVALDELVADAVAAVPAEADTDRTTVAVEACHLVTEPVLLDHVVRNLVDNACKYSTGPVEVRGGCDQDNAWVTVADHGPGIPDGVVDQLFQPFSRTRTDGGASGFGLGLYIVRNLCERLDGTLAVDTGADGTAITVTVPDQHQSPKPSKAASSSDAE